MTSESQHQSAFVKWLDTVAVLRWPELAKIAGRLPYFHIRNEAARGRRWRTGCSKGVPDLFLAVASMDEHLKHGLFIEMKAGRNTTSPEQDMWITWLRGEGYVAAVCHGADAAIEAVTEYLGG